MLENNYGFKRKKILFLNDLCIKETLAQLYKHLATLFIQKNTIFNSDFNYITTHKYNLTTFNF